MRIISQNGALDIPYSDDIMLSVEDKGDRALIFVVYLSSNLDFKTDVIARYSNKEKAIQQLNFIRAASNTGQKYYHLFKDCYKFEGELC